MGSKWEGVSGRWSIVKSLFRFFWVERLWWMIPLVAVMLVIGLLLFATTQSAIAPFIYAVF